MNYLGIFFVGVGSIVLAILNWMGKITLRTRKIQYIPEENRSAFSRVSSISLVVLGVALLFAATFLAIGAHTKSVMLGFIGDVFFIIGFSSSFVLNIYAMIKYRKKK